MCRLRVGLRHLWPVLQLEVRGGDESGELRARRGLRVMLLRNRGPLQWLQRWIERGRSGHPFHHPMVCSLTHLAASPPRNSPRRNISTLLLGRRVGGRRRLFDIAVLPCLLERGEVSIELAVLSLAQRRLERVEHRQREQSGLGELHARCEAKGQTRQSGTRGEQRAGSRAERALSCMQSETTIAIRAVET